MEAGHEKFLVAAETATLVEADSSFSFLNLPNDETEAKIVQTNMVAYDNLVWVINFKSDLRGYLEAIMASKRSNPHFLVGVELMEVLYK